MSVGAVQQFDVVATDLDGTIVRGDGSVSVRTKAALQAAQAADALVILVTGRPPRWLHGIADATGHRGLAICANGALVYDLSTEKILESFPLADEVARELVARLRAAVPGVGFASESIDGDFAREAAYRPRLWPMTEAVADVDELFRRPLAKLLARHEEFDSDRLLEAAREVIGAEVATMTHSSGDGLLEISAVGVSKATTLAAVAAERGRSAEHTIAFGDMPNDLPMLAWAGHSVAVANAHPDVLAAADEVTASVEDDGVAQVLERYFPA